MFKDLYRRVKGGRECARLLSVCGGSNYQKLLQKELDQLRNSEMWRAGEAVRTLRPKELARAITKGTKGVTGRASN